MGPASGKKEFGVVAALGSCRLNPGVDLTPRCNSKHLSPRAVTMGKFLRALGSRPKAISVT